MKHLRAEVKDFGMVQHSENPDTRRRAWDGLCGIIFDIWPHVAGSLPKVLEGVPRA